MSADSCQQGATTPREPDHRLIALVERVLGPERHRDSRRPPSPVGAQHLDLRTEIDQRIGGEILPDRREGPEIHVGPLPDEGHCPAQAGPARDILALNAGAAIYVAGLVDSHQAGVHKALEVLASGAAKAKLDQFVAFTQMLKTH